MNVWAETVAAPLSPDLSRASTRPSAQPAHRQGALGLGAGSERDQQRAAPQPRGENAAGCAVPVPRSSDRVGDTRTAAGPGGCARGDRGP